MSLCKEHFDNDGCDTVWLPIVINGLEAIIERFSFFSPNSYRIPTILLGKNENVEFFIRATERKNGVYKIIGIISEEDKKLIVTQICMGARSYRDIKDREVWPALKEWLSASQSAALESYAPEQIELSNGVVTKVAYEAEKPPSIALKVQQLYGVKETPEISGQQIQVQILAPNQRPWQVTQDLSSFWESGYPQMKKDLAGRYPRHEWR